MRRIRDAYTIKDFYKFYMDEVKDNPLYEVDSKLFKELVYNFYRRMMDHVLYDGGKFHLPYQLGTIRVIKRKVNPKYINIMNIDWVETKKAGKWIYHLNEHSNYYKYLFHWDKYDSVLTNLTKYRLPMTRNNKRILAQLIKSGEQDYYEKF